MSVIYSAGIRLIYKDHYFRMSSNMMSPSLRRGAYVRINRDIYHKQKPVIWDIVIYRYPTSDNMDPGFGQRRVGRIVATEGQTVEIKQKILFVDHQQQHEPFVKHEDPLLIPLAYISKPDYQQLWENKKLSAAVRDNFGPIKVPADTVFVLCDNRDDGLDSRFMGPLPIANIVGKVVASQN